MFFLLEVAKNNSSSSFANATSPTMIMSIDTQWNLSNTATLRIKESGCIRQVVALHTDSKPLLSKRPFGLAWEYIIWDLKEILFGD